MKTKRQSQLKQMGSAVETYRMKMTAEKVQRNIEQVEERIALYRRMNLTVQALYAEKTLATLRHEYRAVQRAAERGRN